MKKVYALYDSQVVLGIFSSMKKATEAMQWLCVVDTRYKRNPHILHIDTFELNGERV